MDAGRRHRRHDIDTERRELVRGARRSAGQVRPEEHVCFGQSIDGRTIRPDHTHDILETEVERRIERSVTLGTVAHDVVPDVGAVRARERDGNDRELDAELPRERTRCHHEHRGHRARITSHGSSWLLGPRDIGSMGTGASGAGGSLETE